MLEMRTVCERCNSALTDAGEAVICSFECTSFWSWLQKRQVIAQ
ncbi:MAG: DUF1272 domain-containing protein [Actinobacteria bacterium]|nr:DUF1272 domain-containing protein [Actinomycetota bacterium]NDF84176.1 DUF1272 domain-containing protein [Actinomycetota bacterium]